VTRSLLDRAIAARDVSPVDSAALAHVLGGLGRELSRPDVAESSVASTPKEAADEITDVILRGLAAR
jgi:hypothetical protein